MTSNDTRVEPLSRSFTGLEEILECQYGLLTELNARGVLTDRQVADIQRPNSTFYEQNDKLIEIITPLLTDDIRREQIVSSLVETGQRHVAKQISGSKIDPCDKDRPLTADESHKIRINAVFLIECIDIKNGLLQQLCAAHVITGIHVLSIEAQSGKHKQIEEFLSIIKRRSFAQFQLFLDSLNETAQWHVSRVLESNGVVLPMDVPIEEEVENVMVDTFRRMPLVSKRRFLDRALSLPGVELLDLKERHSIRFYFLCHSLEALQALRDLVESGQLGAMIESLFNSLLTNTEFVPVHLQNVRLADYSKCEQFFVKWQVNQKDTGIENRSIASCKDIGTGTDDVDKADDLDISGLETETSSSIHLLMDRLSIEAHLLVLIFAKVTLRFKRLDTVLPQRLSANLRGRNKLIFTQDRDEQRFLEGVMEAARAHVRLQQKRKELESQRRSLVKRKKKAASSSSASSYHQAALIKHELGSSAQLFIDGMPLSQHEQDELNLQKLLRRVEDGELLTIIEKDRFLTLQQNQLTRKIETLLEMARASWRPEIQQLEQQKRQLQQEKDELGIALALQSREALNTIQQLGLDLRLLVQLETDHDMVTGVAVLHNCIFVAFYESNVVVAYDRLTFARCEDIMLKTAGKVRKNINIIDMASCTMQSCIYIYDYNNDIIWRAKEERLSQVQKWLSVRGKNYSGTLSVTLDGHLILSGRKPLQLDVYGLDAHLLRTIKLATDVKDPRHVVETSSHNFFVLSRQSSEEDSVFLINMNGDVVKSMSLDRSGFGHISLDGNGYVLVTTVSELLMLDPGLTTRFVVMREDDNTLVRPYRVYYLEPCAAEETSRLIIGYTSGRVDVFCILLNKQ